MSLLVFLVIGLVFNCVLSSPIRDLPPGGNYEGTQSEVSQPLLNEDTNVQFNPGESFPGNKDTKNEENTENLLKLDPKNADKIQESSTTAPDDLMGQETFYPVGGAWWGVRPWGGWGGWGGYRPGWGGYKPGWGGYRPGWGGWHGPHWGGHWGGNLGSQWNGRKR